ncbi:MarR family transcriptional regulator [Skermania sp. ID1734]|uniref:MarR family winged helix-turn-helix transcriptional regulator n=1 Tax=Skermania sp. ID1734 TaxID=2597516 RepID=UPI0011807822|nr:MarR family transcriptional regulator [Skermania sp. ID1734]TSD93635.1 MarR family transcriptional regulator [Skermania sp. ID1734]
MSTETAGIDRRLADETWRMMIAVVMDNRDTWRRAVTERTGLPFSRIRVLRRLLPGPLSMKDLAAAATIDAPAATVAVNDLESRGYVTREIDPGNRRCKNVTLTAAGRELLAIVRAIDDPAPAALTELDEADLAALHRILGGLAHPGHDADR